jgi:hypothetical protein
MIRSIVPARIGQRLALALAMTVGLYAAAQAGEPPGNSGRTLAIGVLDHTGLRYLRPF